MQSTQYLVHLGLGIALLLFTPAVAVSGEEMPDDAPPGGASLTMAKFYPGTAHTTGAFPGKLICLPDKKTEATAGAVKCGNDRYYALSMQEGALVYPLIPGSKDVLDAFESGDMIGKEVEVSGKHYNSTGMILADKVRKAQ